MRKWQQFVCVFKLLSSSPRIDFVHRIATTTENLANANVMIIYFRARFSCSSGYCFGVVWSVFAQLKMTHLKYGP